MIDFIHRNPADIIVFQFLWDALSDGSMEQGQMDRQVGVFVDHIHKLFAHIQCDGQFFPAFPDECLLLGFAWLYLSAHKLPQQPSGLMCRALADHKLVLIPNQSCYYFCGTFWAHGNNSLCFLLTLPGLYSCSPLENLLFILITFCPSSITSIVPNL